jgi:LPXTG-motif cell wall-anchored protein
MLPRVQVRGCFWTWRREEMKLNPAAGSHVSRDVVCDGRRAGLRGTAVLAAICIFVAALTAPQVILAQTGPPTPPEETLAGEQPDPAEPVDPPTPPEPASPSDPSSPSEPPPSDPPPAEEPGLPEEPAPSEEPPAPTATPETPTKQQPQAKAVFVAKQEGGATVTMEDFRFSPATVSINVGDSVTWTNSGSEPHNAVADDESFETAILETGDSETVAFDEAGSFSYICTIHPEMTGTVDVAEETGATDSGEESGVSEEEAVSSPTAAGTDTALPSTGSEALPLAVVGVLLVAVGMLARVRARAS